MCAYSETRLGPSLESFEDDKQDAQYWRRVSNRGQLNTGNASQAGCRSTEGPADDGKRWFSAVRFHLHAIALFVGRRGPLCNNQSGSKGCVWRGWPEGFAKRILTWNSLLTWHHFQAGFTRKSCSALTRELCVQRENTHGFLVGKICLWTIYKGILCQWLTPKFKEKLTRNSLLTGDHLWLHFGFISGPC